MSDNNNDLGSFLSGFLVGGLIAPVAEELFFRGILYGFFRQWGLLFAILSSTMIFVLAHPGASYVQITGGIIFAISYEKEKNLIVPITIHSLGNLSLFSLSLFT
jgi:membrane protease YdiL (CAAX protease family)